MNDTTKRIAGTAGSLILLGSMGAGALTAFADETAPVSEGTENVATTEGAVSRVAADAVQGDFSYSQTGVDALDKIAQVARGAKYLCASENQVSGDPEAVGSWSIAVVGNVSNSYMATVDELRADPAVQKVLMGCSCAGNPADGTASAQAEVTGVAVNILLEKAGAAADANTVVFRSADGYEVALPLTYVTQRYCPIVFDVNGSPIAESMGGANQLWLGSTSARYFARDITSIRVETRDVAPAAPGTLEAGDTYANLPNVGVSFGGEVA